MLSQFMWTFLFFTSSMLSSVYFVRRLPIHSKIFDVGHHILPFFPSGNLIDYLVLHFIFTFYISATYQIIERFMFIIGFVFFLRTLAVQCTVLPYLFPNEKNPVLRFYGFGGGFCDYIFSGHTAFLTLSLIYILKFYLDPIWQIFFVLYYFFICLLIICAKRHYTIDVFLAQIITCCLYLIFDPDAPKINL